MRQCYWCGEVYAGVHACPDNEECPYCEDGRVPTDDPNSPDGKAQCPDCTIE